jgi:ferric-dicitrate binding protein FerR (iron transport regulator)
VLGTAFNVRSYPDEETSETALIRGLVQITLHQNPGETLFLRPNEKLIVSSSSQKQKGNETGGQTPRIILTQIHRLKQENTSIETSWVNNTLAFDNETLEQIALKLERWFDVNVIIKDEALRQATYYGVFDDENLEEVLTALQITGDFKFKIDSSKKEVILEP